MSILRGVYTGSIKGILGGGTIGIINDILRDVHTCNTKGILRGVPSGRQY
jgi:hypothetical protein